MLVENLKVQLVRPPVSVCEGPGAFGAARDRAFAFTGRHVLSDRVPLFPAWCIKLINPENLSGLMAGGASRLGLTLRRSTWTKVMNTGPLRASTDKTQSARASSAAVWRVAGQMIDAPIVRAERRVESDCAQTRPPRSTHNATRRRLKGFAAVVDAFISIISIVRINDQSMMLERPPFELTAHGRRGYRSGGGLPAALRRRGRR
jgi:hypothetical protein